MRVLDDFLARVIVQIVNPIILLISTGAFVVFLWGVFQFVANAGDEKKRTDGRQAIFWGLIGLAVIAGAYSIINVAAGTFGLGPLTPITRPRP